MGWIWYMHLKICHSIFFFIQICLHKPGNNRTPGKEETITAWTSTLQLTTNRSSGYQDPKVIWWKPQKTTAILSKVSFVTILQISFTDQIFDGSVLLQISQILVSLKIFNSQFLSSLILVFYISILFQISYWSVSFLILIWFFICQQCQFDSRFSTDQFYIGAFCRYQEIHKVYIAFACLLMGFR